MSWRAPCPAPCESPLGPPRQGKVSPSPSHAPGSAISSPVSPVPSEVPVVCQALHQVLGDGDESRRHHACLQRATIHQEGQTLCMLRAPIAQQLSAQALEPHNRVHILAVHLLSVVSQAFVFPSVEWDKMKWDKGDKTTYLSRGETQ